MSTSDFDRPYGYIYSLQNIQNGKRYIGQTTRTIDNRWKEHAKCETKHGIALRNAIRKYGPDSFLRVELAEAYNCKELDDLERQFIALFCTTDPEYGYNRKSGGSTGNGYKHTIDAKLKISSSLRGHPVSEEAKAKMAVARRLYYRVSAETKRLISAAGKGRRHSEEAKRKISKAATGHPVSAETRAKISAAHRRTGHKVSAIGLLAAVETNRKRIRTPEERAKMATAIRLALSDPAVRAKLSAARRDEWAKGQRRA